MKGAKKVKNAIFLLSTAAQSNGRVSAAGKCVVLPIRLCTVATRNLLMRHVPYVALAPIMPAMSGGLVLQENLAETVREEMRA